VGPLGSIRFEICHPYSWSLGFSQQTAVNTTVSFLIPAVNMLSVPCHATWCFATVLASLLYDSQLPKEKIKTQCNSPWSTFLLVMLGSLPLLLDKSHWAGKWAQRGWFASQMHHTLMFFLLKCKLLYRYNRLNRWGLFVNGPQKPPDHVKISSESQFTRQMVQIMTDVMATVKQLLKKIQ